MKEPTVTKFIVENESWIIEPLNHIFQFCFSCINKIFDAYERWIMRLGLGFNGFLIVSVILYFGLMRLFYLTRKMLTGNHTTDFIKEFSHRKNPFKPTLTIYGKIIIFCWNVFMMLLSLILLTMTFLAYEQHSNIVQQDSFSYDGYTNTSLTHWQHYNESDIANWTFPISSKNLCHFSTSTKFIEWIDTIIYLLMGNSVMFLHIWHHATVVVAFTAGIYSSSALITLMFNSFIHVVMYLYYALTIFRYLRPYLNIIKIFITTLQLIQFLVAIYFGLIHLNPAYSEMAIKFYNPHDSVRLSLFPTGNLLMYNYVTVVLIASYLILFLDFFQKEYIANKKSKSD